MASGTEISPFFKIQVVDQSVALMTKSDSPCFWVNFHFL